jgi:hypothetical protein
LAGDPIRNSPYNRAERSASETQPSVSLKCEHGDCPKVERGEGKLVANDKIKNSGGPDHRKANTNAESPVSPLDYVDEPHWTTAPLRINALPFSVISKKTSLFEASKNSTSPSSNRVLTYSLKTWWVSRFTQLAKKSSKMMSLRPSMSLQRP